MKNYMLVIRFFLIIPFILFSCGGDDSSSDEDIPIVVEETLEGNYVGGWSSTTSTGAVFTNFPISAKLLFSNADKTRLSGEFFATSNYTSCCNTDSGSNDGTLTIDIDGNTITSFRFNDTIINCTGSFIGTGIINEVGDLIIDFTGTDCDGDHVGQMVFRK